MTKKYRKRKRENKLISFTSPLSPITERFRSIRTSIEYTLRDKDIRIIVLTSPNLCEGTSTTIANLGVTYAYQGKRVLIVDANLRKPSQHSIFRVSNMSGLSTILVEKSAFLREVQEVPGIEGLSILSSGPIPIYPSELLSTNTMKNLVLDIQNYFDIILVDSPPVLVATDAQILTSLCDATLLVVQSEKTEREELIESKKKLDFVKAPILGVIVNQVN